MNKPFITQPGDCKIPNETPGHIDVKVTSADTGSAYTLVEITMAPGGGIDLHEHRAHHETFHVLEGPMFFYLDDGWHEARTGATIHIPAGTPHALDLPDGQGGTMLMLFQPGGFDEFLTGMKALGEKGIATPARVKELKERHDIFELGEKPPRG